jgi:tetratricopeptide (TPR) repeat protein
MIKPKVIIFFCFYILSFLPSAVYASGKGKSMGQDLRDELNSLQTAEAKIEYLEKVREKDNNHFVLFNLASIYLDLGRPDDAELVLLEDLGKRQSLYDMYESYSLLMGIYIDQKREIPEKEINKYIRLFQRMKKISGKEMKDRAVKYRAQSYSRDCFQFERMMGDYFYYNDNMEKAYIFYKSYYEDLNKPVDTFVPDSMRNYVHLLIKRNEPGSALSILGYIINLKPYMLDDIFLMSELYYRMNDPTSSILVLMFAHTLSEDHSELFHKKSESLIRQTASEIKEKGQPEKITDLVDVYLKGEDIQSVPFLIDGLRKEGVRNFFFSYLEGIYFFTTGDYFSALGKFTDFNEIYPYLADSRYYALICMHNLDAVKYSKEIVGLAEKAIELKPDSGISKMTKNYLGEMLGLDEGDRLKLLTVYESRVILNNFMYNQAPAASLDRLLASLTIGKNPYQIALVQLMSGVNVRRSEYVKYLKNVYDLFNDNGKDNIRQILNSMAGIN